MTSAVQLFAELAKPSLQDSHASLVIQVQQRPPSSFQSSFFHFKSVASFRFQIDLYKDDSAWWRSMLGCDIAVAQGCDGLCITGDAGPCVAGFCDDGKAHMGCCCRLMLPTGTAGLQVQV